MTVIGALMLFAGFCMSFLGGGMLCVLCSTDDEPNPKANKSSGYSVASVILIIGLLVMGGGIFLVNDAMSLS